MRFILLTLCSRSSLFSLSVISPHPHYRYGGTINTGVHIHVRDRQWRHVFTANDSPVHYTLPEGVRTITVEEGLLQVTFIGGYICHIRHFIVVVVTPTHPCSPCSSHCYIVTLTSVVINYY